MKTLDKIDCKILAELQNNGRISNVDLAAQINLSPTPCLERVRRLERDGYIRDYVALLDPTKLQASLISFVEISLDRTTPDVFERFKNAVIEMSEVQECHMVAGGFDYLLKVRTADMKAYREFLGEKLSMISGVSQTHTYVVMEDVKSTHSLSITPN